jgi:hypothetical protein
LDGIGPTAPAVVVGITTATATAAAAAATTDDDGGVIGAIGFGRAAAVMDGGRGVRARMATFGGINATFAADTLPLDDGKADAVATVSGGGITVTGAGVATIDIGVLIVCFGADVLVEKDDEEEDEGGGDAEEEEVEDENGIAAAGGSRSSSSSSITVAAIAVAVEGTRNGALKRIAE